MDEDKIFVTVPIDRYEQLITIEEDYNLLTSVLLETARLSYNKKDLSLDDERAMAILKALMPVWVQRKIQELNTEANK